MRQYTTKGNGGTDECVEFFVPANGELQVTRRDALDVEVLCSVASQFENFRSQIFEDGGEVDCSFGADAGLVSGDVAQMTFHPAARELQTGFGAVRLCRGLCT